MFGFGVSELFLVGLLVVVALCTGRNPAQLTRDAGRLTGLWLKLKQKLQFLRLFR